MFRGGTRRAGLALFALLTSAGLSSGCSDGVPTGRHGGDDFDEDDIQAAIVTCATANSPKALVRVTARTDPGDRTYFVRVNFLDDRGEVVDFSSLELDPETGPEEKEQISEEVEFPMNEPDEASKVASCEMDHAF